jgi:thiamine pyrophosphokinase
MMNYPNINSEYIADAVILGDGDYPTHEIPLSVLNKAGFLCCCDGAGMHQMTMNRKPDAIVGDGDSLTTEFREAHRDIVHIIEEQEDNDQTKATRYCIKKGIKRIAYVGTTGKREDHTLGNISLMVRYMNDFDLDVVLLTDYGYFVPAKGRCRFSTFARQQISIFNFTCRNLTGKGLLWPARAYDSWWQGTLNEAAGDSIELDGDGSYLVFRTYNAKIG